jgi:RNA-splicing ligase RtcB
MDWKAGESVECVHNYIGDDNIIRKGAISARQGEKLIIPLNMRDGVILGRGKGNEEWNYSAPHGAGRALSRMEARGHLSLDEFSQEMQGIYTTCINVGTLDEAPMAYKNPKDILTYLPQTATIEDILKPIYNFKAAEF